MFSELVDRVVERSGKPNKLGDIISYAKSTIREQQTKEFYFRDLQEAQLTSTADPYVWTYPNGLRKVSAVQYPDAPIQWPPQYQPGKIQQDEDYYFYAADLDIVFKGISAGGTINVAYYQYLPPLKYYKALDDDRAFVLAYERAVGTLSVRPAIYDEELDTWTYFDGSAYVATLGSAALNLAAQNKVANWLLKRWVTVLEEGTLAKIFKSIGDERAMSTYALYKSLEKDIPTNESHLMVGGGGG